MTRDLLYLDHILEAAGRIEEYTTEGRDTFLTDRRTQDAVLRNFEIIGEATKRLSQATRDLVPEVPWRQVAGLRDVLIHRYETVDLETVWEIVERDVPVLRQAVAALLEDAEPPEE